MGSLANICKITTIVLDVDGVLTDGKIGYNATSDEIKFFHVRDGQRLKLAIRAGLKVGILSGRKSKANAIRIGELGLNFLMEGWKSKLEGWEALLKEQGVTAEECMYVGDDLVDLPPLRRCGLAVAVANACPEVKLEADFITPHAGGDGAVADAVEFLLKGQKKWNDVIAVYYA